MKIDWETIPLAAGMRHGSRRRAVATNLLSAVLVATDADAQFDNRAHRHDNEQILIMVAGSVELRVDDETFTAEAGDLVVFPPGCWHTATAVGPDGAEYYEVFSPPRYDQLPGYVGLSALEWEP